MHFCCTYTQILNISAEFSEADSVVSLCPVSGDKFGYALANGIVGLYSGLEREWRIKVCIYVCMCVISTNLDTIGPD